MSLKKIILSIIFAFYLSIIEIDASNYYREPTPIVYNLENPPIYLRKHIVRRRFVTVEQE